MTTIKQTQQNNIHKCKTYYKTASLFKSKASGYRFLNRENVPDVLLHRNVQPLKAQINPAFSCSNYDICTVGLSK